MPLHKCQICGKTLSRSTKLSEHMRSHTGEKPFQCNICKAYFSRSYDLTKHKELHGGVYKYKCEGEENGVTWGCGKGFHKKGDLNRHLRRDNAEQCGPARPAEKPSTSEVSERLTYSINANAPQPLGSTAMKPERRELPRLLMQDRLRAAPVDNLTIGHGTSWGGVSAGSQVRDDMVMSGTSPSAFQSPLYHSSSYLPKLEAHFMRDFSCCGLILPTLHDLLEHYEKAHCQKALDVGLLQLP